jgi:hypothetical protein
MIIVFGVKIIWYLISTGPDSYIISLCLERKKIFNGTTIKLTQRRQKKKV